MPSIEELQYLGGLFDGEGYAGLINVKRRGVIVPEARLTVAMTDPEPVRLLAKHFGGTIALRHAKQTHWKDQYIWSLPCHKAATVAMRLLPFVRIRRRQQALLDVINKYLGMTDGNFKRTLAIIGTKARSRTCPV